MKFEKGHKKVESRFTQVDRERVWELFFGRKYSARHIAEEYGVHHRVIIALIDIESERRWRKNHPHATNRVKLLEEV